MQLPSSPGVYWFLGADNRVIYVGKAKNLNNRLRSYGRFNQLNPKTKQLVNSTQSVKYETLDSELQSILVEAELIRLHQPHYNILLKDDKSPLYIVVTKEEFPRVLSMRKSDLANFDARRVFGPFPSGYQVKQVLVLARKIFPFCNANKQDKKSHRACFYYHLHLCPGACRGEVPAGAYLQTIKDLELFLQGKHHETIKALTVQVKQAVAKLDFESADRIKKKIAIINAVNQKSVPKLGDAPLPNIAAETGIHRLTELRRLLEHLGLKLEKADRIETYDVANLQGQDAAVSMVVALCGYPDSSAYRHFHIKTLHSQNDTGMLKEAVIRRQKHPEWGMPDLIIVDGGLPQIKAIQAITTWPVPVVGLAKDPDRLMVRKEGKTTFIKLDPTNPGSQLVIKLRDEAHRFARRLHHKTHLKKLFE